MEIRIVNQTKAAFSYSTSRDYLKSVFEHLKQHHQFSMERFAQRINLGPSSLKMILTGKRNLTLSQLHRVGKALKLSSDEMSYLESLILKEKSKSVSEKKFYTNRARVIKENSRLENLLITKKEVLIDPLSLPVLVYLTDFLKPRNLDIDLSVEAIKELAIKFGVNTERINQILSLLRSSGVYSRKENFNQETHYVFDKLTHLLNQKKYITSWLEEAKTRIDKDYNNPSAVYNVTTLSIRKEQIPELKRDFANLIEKYLSEGTEDASETQIVQICTQVIPLLRLFLC